MRFRWGSSPPGSSRRAGGYSSVLRLTADEVSLPYSPVPKSSSSGTRLYLPRGTFWVRSAPVRSRTPQGRFPPARLLHPGGRCGPLGRVTVLALISPMRTERDHPVGFDALPAAQNLLHQRTHVVIAQRAKHAAEVIESVLVSFQQRLLRGVGVGPVKPVARRHTAHREQLQLAQFPIQFGHRLKPIHLTFLAPVVALRHEHFPPAQSHFLFPLPHVSPHGWLRDRMARVLFAQPCPDAVCRVPLLPRRLPVAFQHPVDSLLHRI